MSLKKILSMLTKHQPELEKSFDVARIGVFGSYARGEQRKKSDVDVLVDFKKLPSFFKFLELEEYLKRILGIKVDLVRKNGIREELLDNILSETVYL